MSVARSIVLNIASASSTMAATATGRRSKASRRDSIFDSSISLPTRPSRRTSSWLMIARQRCFSAASVMRSSRSVSMNSRIDVSGVRSSCETDDRNSFCTAGQARAPGHEDGPERPARERRRAERQHQDAAHHRHRLRAALGEEDDAEHGDEHGGDQRRQREDEARAVEHDGRRRVNLHARYFARTRRYAATRAEPRDLQSAEPTTSRGGRRRSQIEAERSSRRRT